MAPNLIIWLPSRTRFQAHSSGRWRRSHQRFQAHSLVAAITSSIRFTLIHHAVDSGVTSDVYGRHTNEILLSQALKGGYRDKVELASKFGVYWADGKMEVCGDPAYLRECCEASLKRIQVDCIDLYYQHRIDTRLPIEITRFALNFASLILLACSVLIVLILFGLSRNDMILGT